MYKIFKITYNNGGWHSGELPHFYYIAESKENVITNSKKYQDYFKRQKTYGGDIWVSEISEAIGKYGLVYDFYFENLQDFDIEISVKKKN